MNPQHKKYGEAALKHLFIGSQLDGIRFSVGPGSTFIRFEHYTDKNPDVLWLHIESKWTVFSTAPVQFPSSEDELNDLTEEQEYKLLFELRRQKIVDVRLGDTAPHLLITFETGNVLFVNGHHDRYECWQVGDGQGYTGDEWFIVAVPGDGIVTQTPDDFRQGTSS